MKTKPVWYVRVFDREELMFSERFERRGEASAYAMRWNTRAVRYRAEIVRYEDGKETPNAR